MVTQATAQETTHTLPPSSRHFEAYRLVKVERKSTREAAKLLRMSQTRVCQVVARVAEYLVDVTEPETDARREKQLAVARQIAAEEINYCKDRALLSFDSRRTLRTVREIKDAEGKVTSVTFHRECSNEPRFLLTIARLGKISSTLPTCTLPIVARRSDESEADVQAGDVELDAEPEVQLNDVRLNETAELTVAAPEPIEQTVEPITEEPVIAEDPSKEDCSEQPAEQPFPAFVRPADIEARIEAIMLYNESLQLQPSSKSEDSETVHPAEAKAPAPTPRAAELQRNRRRRDQRKQRSAKAAYNVFGERRGVSPTCSRTETERTSGLRHDARHCVARPRKCSLRHTCRNAAAARREPRPPGDYAARLVSCSGWARSLKRVCRHRAILPVTNHQADCGASICSWRNISRRESRDRRPLPQSWDEGMRSKSFFAENT